MTKDETKAATKDFLNQFARHEPHLYQQLEAARFGEMKASETPWLKETAVIWPDGGTRKTPTMAPGNALNIILAALEAYGPGPEAHQVRARCAQKIVTRLTKPLRAC